MNFGLSRDLYGSVWCIDYLSASSLSSLLIDLRAGVKLEIPEQKYNSIGYMINSETTFITSPKQLNDIKGDFNGIGIIDINGPITKNGGQSSYGMLELSSMMLSMAKDERIKGFIEINDSGGGQTSAVDIMQDAKNEVKQKYGKPIYTFIPKGSISNSAMYGIASASNKIYSESGMNMVGGTGTLIEIKSAPNGSVDSNGQKTLRIYATKSEKGKNKGFEEAINNDNFEIIQKELLNPLNEHFLSKIVENRPQLKNSQYEDGKTYFAKDVIGTFIDGIASFDEVVNMVLQDSKNYNSNINSNSNSIKIKNSSKMTREQLLQEHPELFNTIVSEGVNQERERVKSLLNYQKADNDFVIGAIKSGESITDSKREELLIKMHSATSIQNLESDSPKPVQTEETTTVVNDEGTTGSEVEKATNFYKNLLK